MSRSLKQDLQFFLVTLALTAVVVGLMALTTDRFRCWLGSAWIDGVLLREMAGKLRDALRMT